jgi:phage tail sheath protein FI
MPEYLYPGVYVEEIDTGNKPIEGVSTSTVGFFGIAERGPLVATLVTSFTEFVRTFGGYVQEGGVDRYLAHGVEGFFQNGGLRCFIMRVASSSSQAASLAVGGMTVAALGPGLSGDRIAVIVAAGSQKKATNDYFKLTILYWSPSIVVPGLSDVAGTLVDPTDPANRTNADVRQPTLTEVYDNLTANPASTNYYLSAVNGVSSLVMLTQTSTAAIPATPIAHLTGGGDGAATLVPADFTGDPTAAPGAKLGLAALEEVEEISILCCPDEHYPFAAASQAITDAMVDQCELTKFRFAILQSPFNAPAPGTHRPPVDSKYAAYYYPWLRIVNPLTGLLMDVPPGGHMAGIYARSDTNRNVAKDPANEPIRMIDSLQHQVTNGQQALLNPVGVNVLRFFKARGNLVWGGRTTSTDPDWKYISVRRLFIFVEKSIQDATQWVVFEPNDAPLWARVVRSVSDFLTGLWRDGMLQGQTKEQAYFVRCDRTTMTQADIDNGRLIMIIGIAPVKPAEFVIFRIGQWTGGADVTEG